MSEHYLPIPPGSECYMLYVGSVDFGRLHHYRSVCKLGKLSRDCVQYNYTCTEELSSKSLQMVCDDTFANALRAFWRLRGGA